MFKKRIILFISICGALALLIWDHIGNVAICGLRGAIDYNCLSYLAFAETTLLPALPFAFFSLLTYKLPDAIFLAWIRFAKWWVPLSIIATILTPETTGSSFVPFIGRGHVALALSAIFVIVSLAIIIWNRATLRDGGEKIK